MAFARDTYYAALYARLQQYVTGVVTWSRRDIRFSRLPSASQPACMVLVANQNSYMEAKCPTVWTLGADIVVWVRSTGQEDSLDVAMLAIADSIEAALMRKGSETPSTQNTLTTLGGTVKTLSFAGPWEFHQYEGAEEASLVIPIDMVVLGDNPVAG